jgi:uncharacterized membrane protein YuzA (DUF378 family)
MKTINKIVYTLLVVGGLNWGLIGAFEYNLVSETFSDNLTRIIYCVIGLAALYGVYPIAKMWSRDQSKSGGARNK